MSLRHMSQTRRRAWLGTAIWSVAGVGFFVTFFMGGGPAAFAEESARHLAGAGALAFGFAGQGLALWLTRQRKDGPLLTDERDMHVIARASQATLVVVLIGIYAFTIGLWTAFESAGSVPVGWMWFLAYASVIVTWITSGIAVLILDTRMGGHG